MQDALFALSKYWTDMGCVAVQPINTEAGAGTLNPATVLRVTGPEPWRAAYVEPSVRPDDSRYGENPNRLQTHHQFQVILKPDPGNPQELYLGSLGALGIDVHKHDVRFVEDNWASPALGAWGLGWEVWLDGLEITQFTYFQQAGGATLNPVSVEITYGMERILMALQQVDHFKKIEYAPGITYGEVFGQIEYEMSRYYLDDADVDSAKRLFEEYVAEAQRMLDAKLPAPAHYQVLKCSHAFNVLDARGAVSTTERARAFARMRVLSREVSRAWTRARADLGYPLGTCAPPAAAQLPRRFPETSGPATLLFEIGTEELPAAEVSRTAQAVRTALVEKLAATHLGHGRVQTFATPRRVVAIVDAVDSREPDTERDVRGPRVAAAYDSDGNPTKAALGFARAQGVLVEELVRTRINGIEYVQASKQVAGRSAVVVLSGLLGEVVAELRAARNMRWNDPVLSFARPVRWLLALLGDVEVPLAVSSLAGGRTTRLYRTDADPVVVSTADNYPAFLAAHGITLNSAERRALVVTAAQRLAQSAGGVFDDEADAELLDEVANLVEHPTPILGRFDERYLDMPAEILTTVMRKHQRYLPVRDTAGRLLPHFVAVANGVCDQETVRAGNEAVLRARYEDAVFFWQADLRTLPDEMKAGLERVAFEERLGSMADRAARIADVALALAAQRVAGPLTEDEHSVVRRSGELAKFDLASQLVTELTSLAGTMAYEYALRGGEPETVARALYEMELPRSTGDALPLTTPGAILALADRFDLLVGLFAVGAEPTGSSDPFGLRRAAQGVVSILRHTPAMKGVTLSQGLSAAATRLCAQGVDVSREQVAEVHAFVVKRYEQQLLSQGTEFRKIAAVLRLADMPAAADATLAALEQHIGTPDFVALAGALQRVQHIVAAAPPESYTDGELALLVAPAERGLYEAFQQLAREMDGAPTGLERFVKSSRTLVRAVVTFFDEVLVMAQEPELKAARLLLLSEIGKLATRVLDWSALGSAMAEEHRRG
ncbi:glycine--tRNA ligase [Streptomyces spectabilis]|uniref:glycine--tRNA ligase n=1 Tax=Streptomyces spectabilis TaxID=68270 RepID=UPI0033CAAA27